MRARLTFSVIIAVVALCVLVAPSAANLRHADYRGVLDHDRNAKVAIKVIQDAERVLFEARHVEIFCSPGSDGREYHGPFRAKLHEDGTFDVDKWMYSAGGFAPDIERFYRVHGQVKNDGSVRGFLLHTRFRHANGSLGEESQYCTSGGKRRWTAE